MNSFLLANCICLHPNNGWRSSLRQPRPFMGVFRCSSGGLLPILLPFMGLLVFFPLLFFLDLHQLFQRGSFVLDLLFEQSDVCFEFFCFFLNIAVERMLFRWISGRRRIGSFHRSMPGEFLPAAIAVCHVFPIKYAVTVGAKIPSRIGDCANEKRNGMRNTRFEQPEFSGS